jgi:hypothetical protein
MRVTSETMRRAGEIMDQIAFSDAELNDVIYSGLKPRSFLTQPERERRPYFLITSPLRQELERFISYKEARKAK